MQLIKTISLTDGDVRWVDWFYAVEVPDELVEAVETKEEREERRAA